jgi:arylsulfatase A-like enzyme
VRDGDWKLVARTGRPWELYDMRRDRSETTNFLEKDPAKADQLRAEWECWAARAGVLPWTEVQRRMAEIRRQQRDADKSK